MGDTIQASVRSDTRSKIVSVAARLLREQGPAAVTTRGVAEAGQRDPGVAEDMYEAVLRHILTDTPERTESSSMATAVALRAIAPRLRMLTDAERQLLAEWLDRAIDAL